MESSSQLPYELIEEDEWNYSFVTRHGVVYHAYFIDFSVYHSDFSDAILYNIESETDNRIH